MTTLSIQFKGMQEEILNKMKKLGFANTKSEAIRMALLQFALQNGLIDSKKLFHELRKELAKDKRRPEEIMRDIDRVKHGNSAKDSTR